MTSQNPRATFGIWPTPLYQKDLNTPGGPGTGPESVAAMNADLQALILEAEQHSVTHTFGMTGGHKSGLDLLRWQHPAVEWLRARIMEATQDMLRDVLGDLVTEVTADVIAEAWAVVYHSGGSHRQHTHHDSIWSGVYYVQTGGVGPDAGRLQILDPRPAAVARGASSGALKVQPKPGLLVAFPSWLPHDVEATQINGGTRICVAFNAAYDLNGAAA